MFRKILLLSCFCALIFGGFGCGSSAEEKEAAQINQAEEMKSSGQPLSRQMRDELEQSQEDSAGVAE